ncbi:MAG: tRNA pseudouridine(38-40) synthase TruA [Opitutales bacterium]
MPRYKCICAYDGSEFSGWQHQINAVGVQDIIEKKLELIFKKHIKIYASGRTDSKVHAKGQCFHFDADFKHSPAQLLQALRSLPRRDILFIDLKQVSQNFNARFDVKSKTYIYSICKGYAMPDKSKYMWSLENRKIDVEKMRQASQIFLGEHDFTAFSASRGKGVKEKTVKTIFKFDIKETKKDIIIETRGSGYLYKMVRILVGSLYQIGINKLTKDEVLKILNAKERTNKLFVAPPNALSLHKVYY